MTAKTVLHNSAEAESHIRKWFQIESQSENVNISGPLIHLDNCVLYGVGNANMSVSKSLFNIHDINVEGITHRKATLDNPYICDVLYDITFRNSVIHGAFFQYIHFHGSVRFDGCEMDTCNFFKVKADKGVYFNDSIIENSIDFNQCEFADSFSLHKCSINNAIQPGLALCDFQGECDFSYMIVKKANLDNTKIRHYFLIRECSFKNGLSLKKSRIDMDFTIAGGNIHNLNLSETHGVNKTRIVFLVLDGINMIDCQNGMKYFKNIEFNNVIFDGDIHIQHYFFENFEIAFCKISNGNRFHVCNCHFDIFKCVSSSIYGRMDLSDCQINRTFELDETSVNGDFILLGSNYIPQITNRYTAMLLKKESQKNANTPDYLKFRSIEMKLLYKELWKKPFKNVSDIVALTFNKFANNFGNSWVYGILFIVATSVLFFHLINYWGTDEQIFTYGCVDGYEGVLCSYLNVLNVFSIVNMPAFQQDMNLNIWGVILLYLAKIIISYGLFQTGMAFRKYNRK